VAEIAVVGERRAVALAAAVRGVAVVVGSTAVAAVDLMAVCVAADAVSGLRVLQEGNDPSGIHPTHPRKGRRDGWGTQDVKAGRDFAILSWRRDDAPCKGGTSVLPLQF